MRAWTNQLSSISRLIILPFALILIMTTIAIIVRTEANQSQPPTARNVSTYSQNKVGVDLQKAYAIPAIADDYTGDTHQQLVNTSQTTSPSSHKSVASQPANPSTALPPAAVVASSNQSTTVDTTYNDSLSSKLNMILSTIILGPQL